MKTFSGYLVLWALLAGSMNVHAQDLSTELSKGKVLLLKNGSALEGDIEKVGSQLCVRRDKSEVWIAQDKTARLCADWADAYDFMQTLIKADDAGDRLKLARWCHLYRLSDKALDQARKALLLQPDSSEAKQLVGMLERALKEPPPRPAPKAPVAPVQKPELIPTVDVTSDSIIAFTTRVQPILMNTCATCHATGHGGKFELERVSDTGSKAATQRNLAAVLTYFDLKRPAISPLLVRAITPHGGSLTPAIKSRDTIPFQSIQKWIEQTIAKNPQLEAYYAAKHQQPVKPKIEAGTSGFATQGLKAQPEVRQPRATPLSVAPPAQERVQPPAPMREWCDPEIFNDWAHPPATRQRAASSPSQP